MGGYEVELRPYQAEAKQAILSEWSEGRRKTLLVLPTGCHAKGEKVLLADGRSKKVEDVQAGDQLIWLSIAGNLRCIGSFPSKASRLLSPKITR